MRTRVLNSNVSRYVWDDVWQSDRYAEQSERMQRALKRAAAFDLQRLLAVNKFVLDVGCGSGEILGLLGNARPDLSLYGVDRSTTAIHLARTRYSDSSTKFSCSAAELLPFADDQFDAVFLFGLLEHVQDYRAVLKELSRVMKTRGVACISSSNAASALQIRNSLLASFGRYRYGYQQNWAAAELQADLEPGFEIQRKFVMHADDDMKLIAQLDRVISYFAPEWGRYICFVVSKRE